MEFGQNFSWEVGFIPPFRTLTEIYCKTYLHSFGADSLKSSYV